MGWFSLIWISSSNFFLLSVRSCILLSFVDAPKCKSLIYNSTSAFVNPKLSRTVWYPPRFNFSPLSNQRNSLANFSRQARTRKRHISSSRACASSRSVFLFHSRKLRSYWNKENRCNGWYLSRYTYIVKSLIWYV